MSAEQIAPLLTPQGWELLAQMPPYLESEALSVASSLRKDGHSPELVSALLSQSKLRMRARAKFGPFADQLLFTPDGLEQATRLLVAGLHAQRFSDARIQNIIDLGSGIGADSLAFASAGMDVTAVDADEITAAVATMNLTPFPNARVIHALAEDTDWQKYDGVWLDPARRNSNTSGTTRIFDPQAFSPPLSFVEQVADSAHATGVKMGPGVPRDSVPESAEVQWLSVDGSVVEATLWWGAVSRRHAEDPVRRSALVIAQGARAELASSTDFGSTEPEIGELGEYIYEPDGAVIRAELIADAAEQIGGWMLDEHIAYFSADSYTDTPFARGFKVVDVMPYNVKKLKSWVKANNIGVLNIKKRGIDVTPEELRKILLAGTPKTARNQATLILTRLKAGRFALVVEPQKN